VEQREDKRGLAMAVAAYGLWGFFPLYFNLLARSGSLEIVAHRIAWTLVFCALGITVRRSWADVRAILAQPRLCGTLLGAGVLVSLNWVLYIYAVISGHVVDAALGYFMNPLVTVALAVVFLHERIRPAQLVALGAGLSAVLVIAIGSHQIPWIGLGLAFSFALYSLAKHRVGHQATPLVGLGIEATALTPFAAAYIVVLAVTGHGTFTSISPGYSLLLASAGVATAIPLLCFAAGAARLSLVSLALIQYMTPVMQFLTGVLIFHEHMPLVRWGGFILVWAGLVVLTWDMIRRSHQSAPPVTPDEVVLRAEQSEIGLPETE
jgi:chloramphenicol-sensitive protein RarD